jgi:hypothetical protein
MKKVKWHNLALPLLIAALLTTGCASNEQYSAQKQKNNDRPSLVSNEPNDGAHKRFGRTMSDQNPNLLNTDGGGRRDRGQDIDKAKAIVNNSKEFRSGNIWIDGGGMWVNVYPKGNMDNQQTTHARTKLHSRLIQALPRYQIEVRVQDDRS